MINNQQFIKLYKTNKGLAIRLTKSFGLSDTTISQLESILVANSHHPYKYGIFNLLTNKPLSLIISLSDNINFDVYAEIIAMLLNPDICSILIQQSDDNLVVSNDVVQIIHNLQHRTNLCDYNIYFYGITPNNIKLLDICNENMVRFKSLTSIYLSDDSNRYITQNFIYDNLHIHTHTNFSLIPSDKKYNITYTFYDSDGCALNILISMFTDALLERKLYRDISGYMVYFCGYSNSDVHRLINQHFKSCRSLCIRLIFFTLLIIYIFYGDFI